MAILILLVGLFPFLFFCEGAATCKGGSIAVFGGTGKLGSECVYQALQKGNKVSVLARNPEKMTVPTGSGGALAGSKLQDDRLHVYEGVVTDQASVNQVFQNNDISGVIIALGGRTKRVGPSMLTDGTANIVRAMKRFGVKRVAVVTSIGCGDSERRAPWSFRALMYTVMRRAMKDKNNQEALFLSPSGPGHDLEFCIARPGGLGTGPATGVVHANYGPDGQSGGEGGSVQRADLAAFLLEAVSDEAFVHLRKTPGISSFAGTSWKKDPSLAGFDAPTSDDDADGV